VTLANQVQLVIFEFEMNRDRFKSSSDGRSKWSQLLDLNLLRYLQLFTKEADGVFCSSYNIGM